MLFLTLGAVRQISSLKSASTGWSRTDMHSVRDFSASMSTHLAISRVILKYFVISVSYHPSLCFICHKINFIFGLSSFESGSPSDIAESLSASEVLSRNKVLNRLRNSGKYHLQSGYWPANQSIQRLQRYLQLKLFAFWKVAHFRHGQILVLKLRRRFFPQFLPYFCSDLACSAVKWHQSDGD